MLMREHGLSICMAAPLRRTSRFDGETAACCARTVSQHLVIMWLDSFCGFVASPSASKSRNLVQPREPHHTLTQQETKLSVCVLGGGGGKVQLTCSEGSQNVSGDFHTSHTREGQIKLTLAG